MWECRVFLLGAASFHRFPWPNRGFVHAPDANTQYFTRPVGPETAKTLEKRIVAGRAFARASWEASGADFLEIRLGEAKKVIQHTLLYDDFFSNLDWGASKS